MGKLLVPNVNLRYTPRVFSRVRPARACLPLPADLFRQAINRKTLPPRQRKERSPAVNFVYLSIKRLTVVRIFVAFLLLLCATASCGAITPVTCDNQQLKPQGDGMTDLEVTGICDVTPDSNNGTYKFHNVNIFSNKKDGNGKPVPAKLIFHDDYDIDFYAESILVENAGELTAVSTQSGFLPQRRKLDSVLPYQKRLTFHLWGSTADPGIMCKTKEDDDTGPCGVPKTVWDSNLLMAHELEGKQDPPPLPKNGSCAMDKKYMNGTDCFYRYEIQDQKDRTDERKAYFGHKVLAVSYGGSLQLFGSKGVSYLQEQDVCDPNKPGNECNPAFTGKSWTRLIKVTSDKTKILVDSPVDWTPGDRIVITPTDYLPSHMEERTIQFVDKETDLITLDKALEWDHNPSTYSFVDVPPEIGPENDPNIPSLNREVDTRAAVALLSRNIQVVSEGDKITDKFPDTGYYYGGHTIVRQGAASYRVQGVEFYLLGQGGQKGRYPVHFHMLRTILQSDDPKVGPLNFLKDCSIHDSMTRWVTVHATTGMYIARNVGEKSIGHGFFLEDATETNNKFYSNIGIFARAAINDKTHNPHQAPGILASNQPENGALASGDYMPYRSDYNHPTIFWIANGWNDFEYNFAAGAATCGACYWWVPEANSGPSQYQFWQGYASQQIVPDNLQSNYNRAGLSPLEKFVGNSCVAAMNSFQMIATTADCLGVTPPGDKNRGLAAVESTAPNGPDGRFLDKQPFQVYYPVLAEEHKPTFCNKTDCAGNPKNPPCDSTDADGLCAVTHLDHYTTSFNFAQTNFAAIWLRKGWDLVTNSAVTDIQTGGLNFITGGGYTRSDVSLGEWLLSRNSIFIGHTQMPEENPFSLDVGPFNAKTKALGVECGTSDPNRCEYSAGGVSFNLPVYPGQKLINIYDGPSHQLNNAFLDITKSTIDDCSPGSASCRDNAIPLARNVGVLAHKEGTNEKDSFCYLPNAAIAWKQPNGFYYPPAFHSRKLWFRNVDIRHFVVEPLFEDIKIGQSDPFVQDQKAVTDRYCTSATNMFMNFNHIDRQTVLNDDDGTLTGLIGADDMTKGTYSNLRPSISINADPFFRSDPAANDKPECLSDLGVVAEGTTLDSEGTARTSPYEWLTTAIIPDCKDSLCFDPSDNMGHWFTNCGNQQCRGVPLYREYLTSKEELVKGSILPQIRMMGQSTGQRSTLTLNRGSYYLDITQSCKSQGSCIPCNEVKTGKCETWGPIHYFPSTFIGGHTYYVYFLYATVATQQKYDLYVGPNHKAKDLNIRAMYFNPNNNQPIYDVSDASFVSATDNDKVAGVVSVSLNLKDQEKIFSDTKPKFCKPKSYCEEKGGTCCRKDLPANQCNTSANDCSWATNDIDCPAGAADQMRCFGFSFTLPATPPQDVTPPSGLFVRFDTIPYFSSVATFLRGESISPEDQCIYNSVPPPPKIQ